MISILDEKNLAKNSTYVYNVGLQPSFNFIALELMSLASLSGDLVGFVWDMKPAAWIVWESSFDWLPIKSPEQL